jgi:hypothetical protein
MAFFSGAIMVGNEKRINEIKIRLEDTLFIKASQLANLDDRTLADYLHHVIALHVFGHDFKLHGFEDKSE